MLLLESKGGGWERKTVRAASHHPAREHQILGTEMILRGVNVNIILTVPPLRVSALVQTGVLSGRPHLSSQTRRNACDAFEHIKYAAILSRPPTASGLGHMGVCICVCPCMYV